MNLTDRFENERIDLQRRLDALLKDGAECLVKDGESIVTHLYVDGVEALLPQPYFDRQYFIEYRYDGASGEFKPIGIWMHNSVGGDVDIFYADPECLKADEANWILNRLVEGDLKTPDDFLEYHQQRAGYRGMRVPVKETETDLTYDQFARVILQQAVAREENDVNK